MGTYISEITPLPTGSVARPDGARRGVAAPPERIDPTLRAFIDAGPNFAVRMDEKLKIAKGKAEALEKEFDEQRAKAAKERLAQIDKLLAAYLLVAQIAAAMGDVAMAEQISDRVAELVNSAGPGIKTLRAGMKADDNTGPQALVDAYKNLTWRVNGLTAKARGFSALVATAYRVAESKEDSDAPGRIERAADGLIEALGGPPALEGARIETSV